MQDLVFPIIDLIFAGSCIVIQAFAAVWTIYTKKVAGIRNNPPAKAARTVSTGR
jgi:hypothetical protein